MIPFIIYIASQLGAGIIYISNTANNHFNSLNYCSIATAPELIILLYTAIFFISLRHSSTLHLTRNLYNCSLFPAIIRIKVILKHFKFLVNFNHNFVISPLLYTRILYIHPQLYKSSTFY